ncbi:hypothetical protein [Absidia glauca]|uniref:GST N-terminal domain-containing protein n=1 Tax=Absidia glauca TaxID=4829 RepID=A0A168RX34_ABSGL|nr:hypothetical protein [Absidia glauca]
MTLNSVQLTYFNIAGKPSTAALGENINLLLKDAGVDYTYRRISHDEWKDIKEDLIKKNVACPTAPFVEVDGKILTKSVPAMRYLSKKLGKFSTKMEIPLTF